MAKILGKVYKIIPGKKGLTNFKQFFWQKGSLTREIKVCLFLWPCD